MLFAIRIGMNPTRLLFSIFRPAALALTLLVSLANARATEFTVDGATYDITIQNLTYGQVSAQDILTSTPWWGDQKLATDLAAAVGGSLGIGTSWFDSGQGPSFVWIGNLGAGADGIGDEVWTAGGVADQFSFGTNYFPKPFATGTVASSVPDSGNTVALLGVSLLGLATLRRRFAR